MSSEKKKLAWRYLREYMFANKGADVSIEIMWHVIKAHKPKAGNYTPPVNLLKRDGKIYRYTQQYVGVYVSHLNARMDMHKIIPGELKRTYRLVDKR